MRHRRKQDSFKQDFVTLLQKGRRMDAIALLQNTLEKKPGHTVARQEWERLQEGRLFTWEEAQARKQQNQLSRLEKLLVDFAQNPAQLAGLSTGALKKRFKQLKTAIEKVGGQNELSQQTKERCYLYAIAINKETERRKKDNRGKTIAGLAIITCVCLLSICCIVLMKKAENAAIALEDVWQHKEQQPDYAQDCLRTYDTGFNRMLNRRVGHAGDRIKHRLNNQIAALSEYNAILTDINNGKGKLTELSIAQRAQIQQLCKLQTKHSKELIELWNSLYLREKNDMDRQQSIHVADLLSPLPKMQELCGIPQDDSPVIQARLAQLKEKINRFHELNSIYKLDKNSIKAFTDEQKHLLKVKEELQSVQTCLKTLPAAHSMKSYLNMLQRLPALQYYTAANKFAKLSKNLPKEQHFRLSMQHHAAPLFPPPIIPHAISTLIYGKNTISPVCPANREQLNTMENIFALSGAQILLYQIINRDGEIAYSEAQPVIKDNKVIFRRSVYDPLHNVGDIRPITWKNPREVWIKPIDLRPLWEACSFNKPQSFFNSAQFPTILSTILNTATENCPALARAYLYHKIGTLIRQHSQPALVGIGYAPTMKQHMSDFEQLRKKCRIELNGMCWLEQTPEMIAAEQAFARWFRQHKGVSYEKEISAFAAKALLITPQFCGYVNEYGEATYTTRPKNEAEIWYAKDGIPCRLEKNDSPTPLSPLFMPKLVAKSQYLP